jgi:hypothetical protein
MAATPFFSPAPTEEGGQLGKSKKEMSMGFWECDAFVLCLGWAWNETLF